MTIPTTRPEPKAFEGDYTYDYDQLVRVERVEEDEDGWRYFLSNGSACSDGDITEVLLESEAYDAPRIRPTR